MQSQEARNNKQTHTSPTRPSSTQTRHGHQDGSKIFRSPIRTIRNELKQADLRHDEEVSATATGVAVNPIADGRQEIGSSPGSVECWRTRRSARGGTPDLRCSALGATRRALGPDAQTVEDPTKREPARNRIPSASTHSTGGTTAYSTGGHTIADPARGSPQIIFSGIRESDGHVQHDMIHPTEIRAQVTVAVPAPSCPSRPREKEMQTPLKMESEAQDYRRTYVPEGESESERRCDKLADRDRDTKLDARCEIALKCRYWTKNVDRVYWYWMIRVYGASRKGQRGHG
ncbi:hypothetical protein FB45DRAFT_874442 [Roridomyces roridus]|uniref:Uncharacterized protein n=1 Tax=Roridomyces roridus TaxID=1738132 RepID=A0AAD7B8T9_9AGAR|nr:hypothetical protein FB45DRAFT_874442 [Roridomyces roridus]